MDGVLSTANSPKRKVLGLNRRVSSQSVAAGLSGPDRGEAPVLHKRMARLSAFRKSDRSADRLLLRPELHSPTRSMNRLPNGNALLWGGQILPSDRSDSAAALTPRRHPENRQSYAFLRL